MRKKIFAPFFLLVAFLNSGDVISSKGSEAANNTCWNCFALCCYPSYSKENEISDVIHDGINWRTRAYVADLYMQIKKRSSELYVFKEKSTFRLESTGFILGQKYYSTNRYIRSVLFLSNPDFIKRYAVDTRDNYINVGDRDLLSTMYDELLSAGQRISQTHKIPYAARHFFDDSWAGAQALNTLVQHFIVNQSDHSVFYNPDTKVLALFSLENERPTFGLFVDADKPDHRTIFSSSSSSEDS